MWEDEKLFVEERHSVGWRRKSKEKSKTVRFMQESCSNEADQTCCSTVKLKPFIHVRYTFALFGEKNSQNKLNTRFIDTCKSVGPECITWLSFISTRGHHYTRHLPLTSLLPKTAGNFWRRNYKKVSKFSVPKILNAWTKNFSKNFRALVRRPHAALPQLLRCHHLTVVSFLADSLGGLTVICETKRNQNL